MITITTDNYFQITAGLDFSTLPDALKKGHELALMASNNGTDWSPYHSD